MKRRREEKEEKEEKEKKEEEKEEDEGEEGLGGAEEELVNFSDMLLISGYWDKNAIKRFREERLKKMLESRPEDAPVKLVKTVETAETVEAAKAVETVETGD